MKTPAAWINTARLTTSTTVDTSNDIGDASSSPASRSAVEDAISRNAAEPDRL
jgi:hypothetical protein